MNVCPECGQTFQQGGFCTQDGAALISAGGDPLLGAMLGPYRVAQVVGVGGMGCVYKGINPTIRSRVAIKVLSHDCADRPELVDRFFAEARAVNLIRHENIVNILDLARLADGRPYIVMEFLDGAPLAAVLAQQGRLPLGTLARWTSEVLAGLGAAHAKSVVHRDLKPDNIFITRHGRAKILDFGVAKLASEPRDGTSRTRAGSLLGTPHYMSPEQAQSQPIDARTDLYAIGVILYEAATGQRPVDGDSVFEILRKQVEDEPPPPRRLAPEIPPAYERVIVRAMAKDPARRWQSAEELAHALAEATANLTPAAWAAVGAPLRAESGSLPPTPAHASNRASHPGPRRSRAPLVAGAALVLAGAALAGIVASRSPGDEAAEKRARGPDSVGLAAAPTADAPAAVPAATPPRAEARESEAGSSPGGPPPAETPRAEQPAAAETPSAEHPEDEVPAAGASPARKTAGRGGKGDKPAPPRHRSAQRDDSRPPPRSGTPGEQEPATAERAWAGSDDQDSPGQQPQQPAFQARSWDVSGYLPTALSRARKQFSDAVLVRIDADGVYPTGKADLTLDDSFSVLYRFMSPSRAKRPASVPQGVAYKPTCMFYVSIDRKSLSAYPLKGWSCEDESKIPMPRCSAKQIWRRAAAHGAPTKNAVGSLSYRRNLSGHAQWWFSIGKDHELVFEDDC